MIKTTFYIALALGNTVIAIQAGRRALREHKVNNDWAFDCTLLAIFAATAALNCVTEAGA